MADKEKMVKATVARGRSIEVPTGTTVTVGTTAEGKAVTRVATKRVMPGETVELPESEVKNLRALGYLADPAVPEAPRGEGPNFGQADGPKVSPVA